jgi:acyl-activating enzyme 14
VEGHGDGAGEVMTRGPHVMTRYWGDAAATARALSPDGWLRTGDLGRIDAAGNLWLTGRLKDVIRSGGENVSAPDVERILIRHPGVAEVAVVGLPHPRLGEEVAALVVLHPSVTWAGHYATSERDAGIAKSVDAVPEGGHVRESSGGATCIQGPGQGNDPEPKEEAGLVLGPGDLRGFCLAVGLSSFKVPRVWAAQRNPLPRNATGKIVKAAVRDVLLGPARAEQDSASPTSRL